ncbi:hypothetical protein DdX_03420 [Ditylenchus destructor]|uniref:CUB domain-containing protein n=1 Tax=Ditylenchus destructor TaxID=166010 RepID=A0AAD4NEY5_9BILA|nr:hypothetical protein DdX_03420 [Ditylenchus destructor]
MFNDNQAVLRETFSPSNGFKFASNEATIIFWNAFILSFLFSLSGACVYGSPPAELGRLSRCQCENRTLVLSSAKDKRAVFSPQFPRPYCANLHCQWRVFANTSHGSSSPSIHFSAKNIDLRHGRDFIIFDDKSNSAIASPSNSVIGNRASVNNHDTFFLLNSSSITRCTGNLPLCEYTSNGTTLTIFFISGSGLPDNFGFQGTVTIRDPYLPALVPTPDRWPLPLILLIIILIIALIALFIFFIYKAMQKRGNNRNEMPQNASKESTNQNDNIETSMAKETEKKTLLEKNNNNN